ncbi:MAG: hypothetical protein R2831_10165 [Chitinophagaceae bacterium]
MKNTIKIISTFIYLLLSASLFAQAPQQFNYQGIARDAKGNPLNAQTLSIKLASACSRCYHARIRRNTNYQNQ